MTYKYCPYYGHELNTEKIEPVNVHMSKWGEFAIPYEIANKILHRNNEPISLPVNKEFWYWLNNEEIKIGKN